jgi:hypothetical protein
LLIPVIEAGNISFTPPVSYPSRAACAKPTRVG